MPTASPAAPAPGGATEIPGEQDKRRQWPGGGAAVRRHKERMAAAPKLAAEEERRAIEDFIARNGVTRLPIHTEADKLAEAVKRLLAEGGS